ncbi:hypothetical protein Tco_0109668 [Tanacetum coccineum]
MSGGSSTPLMKRKLASRSSSSCAVRAKNSTSKDDDPILSISDDDNGLPDYFELKYANACHLKISAITSPTWKGHLDNQMDLELLDLHDRYYERQAVVNNVVNRRAHEFLHVIKKMRGESDVIKARERSCEELRVKCEAAIAKFDQNPDVLVLREKIYLLTADVKEHKGNLDRMMLESQKLVGYQVTLLTLESKVDSLEAEKARLEAIEVSLCREVEELKQNRRDVVSKVKPYAALDLVHSDALARLVGTLVSFAITYGHCRAYEQVAAMKEPFNLSKAKDAAAPIVALLSKKPPPLQKPAPSRTQMPIRIKQYFQYKIMLYGDVIEMETHSNRSQNNNKCDVHQLINTSTRMQDLCLLHSTNKLWGNVHKVKTQKTLLKQMYENFSALSTESLDSIFNRLQKIRNKPDLDTICFDDLYNNFKIVEQEKFLPKPCWLLMELVLTRALCQMKKSLQTWLLWIFQTLRIIFTPNLDLSNSSLEEFQQLEFEGYEPKTNKSVNEDTSNELRKSPDALLIEELVSNDQLEKKTIFPTIAKINFIRSQQQEKPVRKPVKYAEMYRSQTPRGNERNWNNQKSQQLGSNFVMYNKACFVYGSFDHVQANCNYHQRERMVFGNNYTRVNYNYSAKKSHPRAHRNIVPRAVLMKTGLRPFNTVRPVNTAHPKNTVYSARPMPFNTAKGKVNTARPKAVNTARPNTTVVNAVRANQVNDVKASACWVWRPIKLNSVSITFKRHNYVDARGISKLVIA